jgi:inner membrane protein
MNPITHLLIGWTVASAAPSLNRRERAMVTWASVVPDVDGLGVVVDWATRGMGKPTDFWGEYHHTLAHNIGFALLVTLVAAVFARQKALTAALVFLSFHLHLLGDLMGARGPDGDHWPIPYLRPFSNALQLEWAGQWALNAWPNIVLTGVLILIALVLARRRSYSPVELFSRKADEVLVRTLRSRFPVKEEEHSRSCP